MKAELRNSGMSEEEILKKTCVLMKAFNREDPGASMAEYNLASKQKNLALKNNGTSPKDFTLVSIALGLAFESGATVSVKLKNSLNHTRINLKVRSYYISIMHILYIYVMYRLNLGKVCMYCSFHYFH